MKLIEEKNFLQLFLSDNKQYCQLMCSINLLKISNARKEWSCYDLFSSEVYEMRYLKKQNKKTMNQI